MNKIIFLFIVLIIGCKSDVYLHPYPYKVELNNIREQLGLKVYDSTFFNYSTINHRSYDSYSEKYVNIYLKPKDYRKLTDNNIPYFYQKIINLDKRTGKPLYEVDIYRSGFSKFGYKEETKIYEQLKVSYVFEDYKYFDHFGSKDSVLLIKGLYYTYGIPLEDKNVTSNRPDKKFWKMEFNEINKDEADSILNSWGLTD